ncbi:putative kinesin-like protein [Plasmopara halstedii]
MGDEYCARQIAQSLPRESAASSVHYSGHQMPLLNLTFQEIDSSDNYCNMSSRSSRSRHEDEYLPSDTTRVANEYHSEAAMARSAASWHAGNGTTATYELCDESAMMEAADPVLFQAAVEEHSRRLGLDPAIDTELLWIAKQSLIAPLPDAWYHVTASETGQPYYYNEMTGESRWDHPCDDEYRQLVTDLKQKKAIKTHAHRHAHPVAYYHTGGYHIGKAWQETEYQEHHTAQTKQGWNREDVQNIYNDYNVPSKGLQSQVFTSQEDERHRIANSLSLLNEYVKKLEEMDRQKTRDDEAIAGLKLEIADFDRQLTSRDEELAATKSNVKRLTGFVSELKQQVQQSLSENEDIIAVNQTLTKELSLSRSRMKESIKLHEEAVEAQQTLAKELALAQTKLKETQLKQSGTGGDVALQQSQIEIEHDTTIQLKRQLQQTTDQHTELLAKMEVAQATIRKLQQEAGKHSGEEVQASIAEAAEAIKTLKFRLHEKEKELTGERTRAVSFERELTQLRTSRPSAEEQDLQKQLKASVTNEAARQKEFELMESTLATTIAEKVALEKQLEEFKITCAAQIKDLEDHRLALKREFKAVDCELKAQQVLAKEREDELSRLKIALQNAEIQVSSVAQTIQKERKEAYAEAQHASAEIIRQSNEEKTRAFELYTHEMMARRKLHNRLMELQGNIRVFCRVRPIQPVELNSDQSSVVVFFRDNDHESLELFVGTEVGDKAHQIGQKHPFEFDYVFQPESSQEQVFEQTRALVVSALDGFNVCIFAYGQTGSGKTHTMEGPENDRGVNYRALRELFALRDDRLAADNFECTMKLSILEVYNEAIVDLLEGNGRTSGATSPSAVRGLDVRVGKNGVYVENLIEVEVSNESDVLHLMRMGHSHRSVGSHDFNEHSSRSHLVLSISIETGIKSEARRRISKMHLIDLAGSERVSKTAASGQRLKEAQNINRSLSALGDVIAALGANSKHVPYRNSKLTFLLQDSLSGNSKVLMFVNVSPVQWNAWETLCSLNFASRCRSVALGQAKAMTATSGASNGMQTTMSMHAMIPKGPTPAGTKPLQNR